MMNTNWRITQKGCWMNEDTMWSWIVVGRQQSAVITAAQSVEATLAIDHESEVLTSLFSIRWWQSSAAAWQWGMWTSILNQNRHQWVMGVRREFATLQDEEYTIFGDTDPWIRRCQLRGASHWKIYKRWNPRLQRDDIDQQTTRGSRRRPELQLYEDQSNVDQGWESRCRPGSCLWSP